MYEKYGIYIFDNIFPDDICEKYIKYIKKCAIDAKIEYPTTNITGREVFIEPYSNRELTDIFYKLSKMLEKMTSIPINKNIIGNTLVIYGDSGYHMREINGKTRIHCDDILTSHNAETINTKNVRCMSIIGALNDYEGGVIYFPRQGIKIKLKKGQALAFPPYWTHPHEVSAPENGTVRYTITTWMYGDIPGR